MTESMMELFDKPEVKKAKAAARKAAKNPNTGDVFTAQESEMIETASAELTTLRNNAASATRSYYMAWREYRNQFDAYVKETGAHSKGGLWGELCKRQQMTTQAVAKNLRIADAMVDGALSKLSDDQLPLSASALDELTKIQPQTKTSERKITRGKNKGEVRKEETIVQPADVVLEQVKAGNIQPSTPRDKLTQMRKELNGEKPKAKSQKAKPAAKAKKPSKKQQVSDAKAAAYDAIEALHQLDPAALAELLETYAERWSA